MKLRKESIILIAITLIVVVVGIGAHFLYSGEQEIVYAPYSFHNATFDLPSDTVVHDNQDFSEFSSITNGSTIESYDFTYYSKSNNFSLEGESFNVELGIVYGGNVGSSIDNYVSSIEDEGAIVNGTYGNWTILNISDFAHGYDGDYLLVTYNNGTFYNLCGDNLDILKEIVDSFKVA